MRTTSGVVLAVVGLTLALVLGAGPARQASATCSIGGGPRDYPRYAQQAVQNAPFVFVGTVTSERPVPRPPNTASIWESVVVPQAMLRGELPDEPLVIPYTGFLGADCSGGPRLREGEQVLIAIYRGVPSYGHGEEAWLMHGTFSKVLLEDGQAILEWTAGSQSLGTAETAIREYGVLVGADEAQIGAAIAAVGAPVTPGEPQAVSGQDDVSDSGNTTLPWLLFGVGAGLVAALAVIGLRRRLSSNTSGTRSR